MLIGRLDQTQRSLNALFGSVQAGGKVYDDASKFADKYAIKQSDIATAVSGAARVIKDSNAGTTKTLEVLARLQTLNPEESIAGASRALSELAAGDVTSIVERFNIPRKEINKLKKEIEAGADPVRVLDDALNKMGITSQVLKNRLEGPQGAANRLAKASEDAKIAFGRFLDRVGASKVFELAAEGLNKVGDAIDRVSGKAAEDVQFGALQDAKSYSEYARKIDQGNKTITQSTLEAQAQAQRWGPLGQIIASGQAAFTQQTDKLTEAQFSASKALQEYGITPNRLKRLSAASPNIKAF